MIPVPDSGNAAARGLARAAGLPQDDGFIKNRYVARTFIQPGQELRKHGLRLKFNPLPEVVGGQATCGRRRLDRPREHHPADRADASRGGAAEVHLRISAPPIKHPCHYGIDMSTREEMIAHGRSVEEIAEELGADSLHYLSLEGVYQAVGISRESHCDACFSGQYPLAGTEEANGKFALESELPLVRALGACQRRWLASGGPADRRGSPRCCGSRRASGHAGIAARESSGLVRSPRASLRPGGS